jgi:hypothetical protein
MTATVPEHAGAPGSADAGHGSARAWPAWATWLVIACCVGLALASLAGPSVPTYDPTAWMIWGREIAHGTLETSVGPSWKPLPVMVTAPLSLIGDTATADGWLVIARAGMLLALVAAARVAWRLGGVVAAVVAVVALALVNSLPYHAFRGESEGLLVALALWAVDATQTGHHRRAFALAVLAGLLRPEVWPFVVLSGLWLVLRARRAAGTRAAAATAAAVATTGLALAALWFVPEKIGSGRFLRGAQRAREAVAGSPGQTDHPFLSVFTNSTGALSWPVYVGAVVAVAVAAVALRRRGGGRQVVALAAAASLLMVVVAVLAQGGFTGNLRYVMLPASLLAVLAGVGWSGVLAWTRGRAGLAAAIALAVVLAAGAAPFVAADVSRVDHQYGKAVKEAQVYGDLPAAIAAAGGRDAVLRCGPVWTSPTATQAAAWLLHVPEKAVGIHPTPPGTLFAPWYSPRVGDDRFALVAKTGRWVVRAACVR